MTTFDFNAPVRQEFQELTQQFGMTCTELEFGGIRIASNNVAIDFLYEDRLTFEVSILFSVRGPRGWEPSPAYELSEVFRHFGISDKSNSSFLMTRDTRFVVEFLRNTCRSILANCTPLFEHTAKVFADLAVQRKIEAHRHTRTIQLQAVKGEAEAAWRDKRFGSYVALLEPFAEVLEKVDFERLTFAKGKLQ